MRGWRAKSVAILSSGPVRYASAVLRPRRHAAVAAAAIVLAVLGAGCSSGGAAGHGSSSLTAALGRVADTSSNRAQIWYDDTAALVRVAGRSWHRHRGFALLRGVGAPGLVPWAGQISAGIRVIDENYAIAAGTPPRGIGLLAGGQQAGRVTGYLARLGWKPHGRGLRAPPLRAVMGGSTIGAALDLPLAQVRADGQDLRYGYARTDLREVGQPAGRTLAGDPVVGALARCLGHVVAAWIGSYPPSPPLAPAEVAVGVRAPAGRASVPQAVGCSAWRSAAAAAAYRLDLDRALLGSGVDPVSHEPFSRLLPRASVHGVGGAQHLVSWQADSPGHAPLVFKMVETRDLPALP